MLPTTDPTTSAHFFAQLGFSILFQDREDASRHIGIADDNVELHLQWSDTPTHSTGDRPVYRFLDDDVDALHRAFAESDVFTPGNNGQSPWSKSVDTPWGTREFHLSDQDGNGLQFYRARVAD